ncbi:putative F-box protein AFR [Iris pallida]|uniref:F-box protein AFR n=1 Tax=Iris pallida TaxID=29817 RepID=A0AAX6EJM5_IRIPA|nr:putative F-box protein AFR [Iris pallida]
MSPSSVDPSPASAGGATDSASSPVIPGLPDDVAELCLLHLPFPHRPLARSVSSSWNRTLKTLKSLKSLDHPFLFVLSSRQNRSRLHFHAFDPLSATWLLLPPPPTPFAGASPVYPSAPSAVALREKGEIFLFGGMGSETGEVFRDVASYSVSTNSWSVRTPMGAKRSFFAAGSVGGRVVAAGGGEATDSTAVERYEPDTGRWAPAAGMRCGMARYDAAVIGTKMFVTEGWTWPFTFSPRGEVYDAERDVWEEMSIGLREGWTGVSAVVGTTLFVVSEYGEGRVKVYDPASDSWASVAGSGVPSEVRKPYAVSGAKEGRIYIVGKGLNVGVGTVVEEDGKGWSVHWELVKGPKSLEDLAPCSSQVLYA